jgi:hypothetical protein
MSSYARAAQHDTREGSHINSLCCEFKAECLVEIFGQIQPAVAYCLQAAVASGDLPAEIECEDIAALIVSSLQGAT